MDPIQMSIAIMAIGVVGGSILWRQSTAELAAGARRAQMMARVGVMPGQVSTDDPLTRTVGKRVARNCGRCLRVDLCERWLDGEYEGSNVFCPNADTFDRLLAALASEAEEAKAA